MCLGIVLLYKIFPGLIASIIGALVGALAAFQVNRWQTWIKETKSQKASGNLALFLLQQQITNLVRLEESELSRWRGEAMKDKRWLRMLSFYEFSELPTLHIDDLGWLLETDDPNLLSRMLEARNRYLTVLGLLEIRKHVKARVDDQLESLKCPANQDPDTFILEHLTERQIVELRISAEAILDHSLTAIKNHLIIMADLHIAMKKIWPKEKFIMLNEPTEALLNRLKLTPENLSK